MSESLAELSVKLAQILLPIIMVLGIIGNSLNILILTRANLRNHACSHYFLALSSNNLIYSIFLIYFLLANGYNMDGETVSVILCKILQYISNIISFGSPYLIVLASIDRFCASSSIVKLRRFSNITVARWSILILIIFCILFFINTLVLNDLRDDGYGCNIRPDNLYNQLFVLIEIILYAGVPPCLMIIFGLLTIYNTSQVRVLPHLTQRYRRTEGQLARMLILQVAAYILLNIPLCIIYLMLVLPTGYVPTYELYFAYSIVAFPFHFSYGTTFFLYILSARVYREELIRLISKLFRVRGRNQIHPILITNNLRPTAVSHHTLPAVRH